MEKDGPDHNIEKEQERDEPNQEPQSMEEDT